jgi:hypothetical protein
MTKEKKKGATKYDEKLTINAGFDDIIKPSATPYTPAPKKEKKSAKKKSN